MTTVKAEIEVVVRVPGTLVYDHQGFIEYLDGRPATNDELFEYIRNDPDWLEGSDFPAADASKHDVIESEMVSVNDNQDPVSSSADQEGAR